MFIKFDEIELSEFFESDPISIGEYEEGNWLYSMQEKNFKMILLVQTYEQNIEVSISYNENIVFSGKYSNVKSLKKSDDNILYVILENENRVILKKGTQLGVVNE
jgi:hypothetical protein